MKEGVPDWANYNIGELKSTFLRKSHSTGNFIANKPSMISLRKKKSMNQIDEEQEATSATALHKKVSLGQSFKALLKSDRGTEHRITPEVNPDLADISTLRKDEAND